MGIRNRIRLIELAVIRKWAARHECVVSNVGEIEIHERIMDILVKPELIGSYIRECLTARALEWHGLTAHPCYPVATDLMNDARHRMGTAARHVADFLSDALGRMPHGMFKEACKLRSIPRIVEDQPPRDPAHFPPDYPVETIPMPNPLQQTFDARSIMLRRMVDNLNELVAMDSPWVQASVRTFYRTNQQVADSPNFMAAPANHEDGTPGWAMSTVGLLNGIVGHGDERIACNMLNQGPDAGKVVGFSIVLYNGPEPVRSVYPIEEPVKGLYAPPPLPHEGDQLRINNPADPQSD